MDLFCNGCNHSIDEDSLFTHLRKKHGLSRGGKKKQQALREHNVDPVRTNFDVIYMRINPLFVREMFVRYLRKSFHSLTAALNAKNVDREIPRFMHRLVDEDEDNVHLVIIALGI